VDQWIVIFRGPGRESASTRAISSPEDRCGQVDKLCTFFMPSARPSAIGAEGLEDLARQNRTARDESGAVAAGGRPLAEQPARLLRRGHPTGGGGLARSAEGPARRT